MKTTFNSSLLAMLLLCFCVNLTQAQDNKLYDHVELKNPPMYPGGMKKFYDVLGSTMKYPPLAAENNIQGTAFVSFTIEKDGSLTDVKTEGRKLGYGLEEEAVRSIKSSGKWTPGSLDGKPVRVKYNIPVKFAMPGKPKKVGDASNDGKTVYSHVSMENPPTYPGGMHKLYEFLGKNITYPKAAISSKIQGIISVAFTIEKDGSLSDIKSLNDLGGGTAEEAVRVMKLSKSWSPGLINGTPVRVKYNLPIKFTMKK